MRFRVYCEREVDGVSTKVYLKEIFEDYTAANSRIDGLNGLENYLSSHLTFIMEPYDDN